MKCKVVFSDYEKDIEVIVEADTRSKATYKVFKSQLGISFIKTCKFGDFLKFFYRYTEVYNEKHI